MTGTELPEPLAALAATLEERRFAVDEQPPSESFGDQLITFADQRLRVRLTRDRSVWTIELGHPDWDVLWSAATDLGMVASIHVGNLHAGFGRWADIGWDQPGGAGPTALTRLANTQNIHLAQNILVSMLYGGVFHRHPDLTVRGEELVGEVVGRRARDARHRPGFHHRQQIRHPDLNCRIAHRNAPHIDDCLRSRRSLQRPHIP